MTTPENVVNAAVHVVLSPRERELVTNRFGLRGVRPCASIDEVADRLGVSRLNAKRDFVRAVSKLRQSEITRKALDAFHLRRAA